MNRSEFLCAVSAMREELVDAHGHYPSAVELLQEIKNLEAQVRTEEEKIIDAAVLGYMLAVQGIE